ncbi:MAG: Bcr/CflA family drug resistance efflux transporter [Betaproteobacteria bacterium HGW-Betaproteobacteria-8]|jgi:DHA1 family bicyclomycin/chloramphenicol resistance-like MFS transporter|nr:MAG: Bcr/CflA family drug resistance efflux transporter [Betaproteobacteria bacterium HGW-Betaproteobacteria-8]PKO91803.1 MAG: Bcr/CflA family drug resistance efflux transporter [Betaproteobacteria bacterium HGW-Betaproteobacteria-1]
MKSSNTVLVLVLASLAALAPFAIDTYLPAFGALERDLGASTVEVQQSLTFYLLPYALMTLWHGAISDAIGRISAIKWGLGLFVFASIGCALAPNVETLWFFRVLQGIGGGAGNVVARAMVRDLFEGAQAQRVMATVQMLFGIAPAVAPVIGGLLLGIHWQAIFVFLASYAALSLWAAMKYLPETMPAEKRIPLSTKSVLSSYKTVYSDREFNLVVIALGANFSGFFIYVLSSPVFLIQHLNLTEYQFGWLFIPTVLGMVLGSYLAKRAAGRMSSRKVIQIAYAWMSLMVLGNLLVCYFLPPHFVYNILPVALFNIGMALAMPILSIAALDRHPRIRGTAASGQAFVQMLLSTVSAGMIVPLVWDHPLGLAMAMAAYVSIGWLAVRKSRLLNGKAARHE